MKFYNNNFIKMKKTTLAVAENVLKVKEDLSDGFVITNFPNNAAQAQKYFRNFRLEKKKKIFLLIFY